MSLPRPPTALLAGLNITRKTTHVIITSRNSKEHASLDYCGSSLVGRLRAGTAQAHVHHGLADGTIASGVIHRPFHTSNDTRVGATSRCIENFRGDDSSFFGKSVSLAGDGASNVGSVTIAICIIVVDGVGAPNSTSLEFGVLNIDTSIDNVGGDTLSSSRIVDIVTNTRLLGGDASKTPCRSVGLGLKFVGLDDGVRLDVVNLVFPSP